MGLPALLDLGTIRGLYAEQRLTPHDLAASLSRRMSEADPATPRSLPERGLRIGVLRPEDREFFGDS